MEKQAPKRHLITAALPYANGPLHIGHLAGAYLSADVYARYLRLKGQEVAFICGSDEHGAAITLRAKREGLSPKEIVDKYHENIKDTFGRLRVSFDCYHRTTEPLHHQTAQDFFRTVNDKGGFELVSTEQYFDEAYGQFLADRYIMGTCPKCGNVDAYGDQCERCGSTLSPTELIEPRSTLSGQQPVLKPTTHWFFPLDRYSAWLEEWLETGKDGGVVHHYPQEWKKHVLGQCRSWIAGGLTGRAMTRDLDWGVDVPQEIPGAEHKKLYVWMDAPIGYISATIQWASEQGKDWKEYWMSEDTQLVHFIGKDNIVFHCIIFPALLKAHGDFILPYNVPANQFMNLEGNKISTSRNWAVWAHEYLDETATSIVNNVDVLRYVMIKNMPEQKDSEFLWSLFKELNDSDLVGKLAGFVHRTMVLTQKYYEGRVPDFDDEELFAYPVEDGNEQVVHSTAINDLYEEVMKIEEAIEGFNFREALGGVINIAEKGNRLLQFNEPWKQIKEKPAMVEAVMNTALQMVAALRVLVQPFMPDTADKLSELLQLPIPVAGDWAVLQERLGSLLPILASGHVVGAPQHLFGRIPDEAIQLQLNKLQRTTTTQTEVKNMDTPEKKELAAVKTEIVYDDFAKMDLRTGTIQAAERMPKSDKLLRLTVNLGFEERTIVSGIAKHFTPEEVIGQRVLVLVNLAPRKMMGVESAGMILLAEDTSGKLHFVAAPSGADNGWEVR
jgi:methionyl-tRNA synthetase